MIKWLTGITDWILIYTNQSNKSEAEIGFIFKINPNKNLAMMSGSDIEYTQNRMAIFLGINNYTFSIIRKKVWITDYDYLPNYEEILKKKDIKWKDNELHKLMLHWTAKMIQEYTKWTTKHEYFLKVNTQIYDTTSWKAIIKKHKEITNIINQFPFRIEKMLDSEEVIRYLLKEWRFFTSELNTLTSENMKKQWFYKDIL
jgi:hypothetical protein